MGGAAGHEARVRARVCVCVVAVPVAHKAFTFQALRDFLLQLFHAVHQGQRSQARGIQGGQDFLHPGIGFAAHINEEIGFLNADNVLGGGLKGMAFCAGRQKLGHLHPLAADLAGEIVGRKDRGDNRQGRLAVRGGIPARALSVRFIRAAACLAAAVQ